MQVARSQRSSIFSSRRRLALGLAAGIAASTVAAVPFSGVAVADPGDPLGPTLIRTDAPPSGMR